MSSTFRRPLTLLVAGLSCGCATGHAVALGDVCAVVQPHPPLTGTQLSIDESGSPRVQVLLLPDPNPGSMHGFGGLPVAPFSIARGQADLERLGVSPAIPIDFARWIVVVPGLPGDVRARAEVKVANDRGELQLWRVSGDAVEAVYAAPCVVCGGASIVELHRQMCLAQLERYHVFLVPRPRERLTIGFTDPRCDPRLP